MKLIRRKEGILVIEAALVMSLVVVFIVVLINLGLILYQRTLVRTVAYDTANQISHIVGTRYRDPFMAYKTIYGFHQTDLYRHMFDSEGDMNRVNEDKAVWYAYYRLRRGEILLNTNPHVEVELTPSSWALMPQQIEVTIRVTYEIPLTAFWGGEHRFTYEAVARASAVDLIHYVHFVDFFYELTSPVAERINLENIRRIRALYDRLRGD